MGHESGIEEIKKCPFFRVSRLDDCCRQERSHIGRLFAEHRLESHSVGESGRVADSKARFSASCRRPFASKCAASRTRRISTSLASPTFRFVSLKTTIFVRRSTVNVCSRRARSCGRLERDGRSRQGRVSALHISTLPMSDANYETWRQSCAGRLSVLRPAPRLRLSRPPLERRRTRRCRSAARTDGAVAAALVASIASDASNL